MLSSWPRVTTKVTTKPKPSRSSDERNHKMEIEPTNEVKKEEVEAVVELPPLQKKFMAVKESVNKRWVEREELVEACILSILSGADMLALGKPGCAKSAVIKDVLGHFDGEVFARQLNQYSTDKDLLGDINPKRFMESGQRVHEVPNTLLDCDLAFIDEVFKGSKGARTALLEPLADRQFSENGQITDLPLLACLTASNELPADKGDAAFYSRLQVRVMVHDIRLKKNIVKALYDEQPDPDEVRFTRDDVQQAREEMSLLKPTSVAKKALTKLFTEFEKLNLGGDQRKRMKAFGVRGSLAQAKAWLSGHDNIERSDMCVAKYVFWNKPNQENEIASVVASVCKPEASKVIDQYNSLVELFQIKDLESMDVVHLEEILTVGRKISKPKNRCMLTSTERSRLKEIKEEVAREVLRRQGKGGV